MPIVVIIPGCLLYITQIPVRRVTLFMIYAKNHPQLSRFSPSVIARMKILVSTDISVLRFYGYIGRYFYMNIDISKINKNTFKFMDILSKSVKMTLIIKYIP